MLNSRFLLAIYSSTLALIRVNPPILSKKIRDVAQYPSLRRSFLAIIIRDSRSFHHVPPRVQAYLVASQFWPPLTISIHAIPVCLHFQLFLMSAKESNDPQDNIDSDNDNSYTYNDPLDADEQKEDHKDHENNSV